MKNRSWLPLSLDILGLLALAGAAVALAAALFFAGSTSEIIALDTFKYCLMGAVIALLVARASEIATVLQTGVAPQAELPAPNNVESLPERDTLPRAA